MTIVEPAPAKLNLALHVRRRRADGYHDLETLFAFVADGDVLTVAPADADGLTITGPFADGLSPGEDNLVARARAAYAARIAPLPPLTITLDKRLPVASGIGGGSADAAAMLRAAAQIAGTPLDDSRLFDVAAALGSDVPACLLGRTAIGGGRGERLAPLDGLGGTPVLLINPGVALSTAQVFGGWDGRDRGPLPDGDAAAIAAAGRNDLEPPATAAVPEIASVLRALRACAGVGLVRMSGSGATCFATFADTDHLTAAARSIGVAHPAWWLLLTKLT